MDKTLDDKLVAKYPKIFRDRHASLMQSAMPWGFECDDGWYNLIDHLCEALQWDTDMNKGPQVITSQVKEKYAGLRFYTQGHSNYQDGMISFAEKMSQYICEECGHPGKVKSTGGHPAGWMKTLCDSCAEGTDYMDYPEDE